MRIAVLLLLSASWPAFAQVPPPPPPASEADDLAAEMEAEEMAEDIVVTGRSKPIGSVIGDIEPEVTLSTRDIRAYGASNLAELLEELAPLTGSIQGSGGQPVTLLGGRRISSFREIRDLPPEAVLRVDILPEEVALKYG
jgi:hypothetical protein